MMYAEALDAARRAVAAAELGETRSLELGAPARPVLAELIAEGALDRALLLLERDGEHARVVIAPRRTPGRLTVAEVLEEEHRRLDVLAEEMFHVAGEDPVRAVVVAHLFAGGLRRHFRIEEEILFPLYEKRSGVGAGPTNAMRREHGAMGIYLARMIESAERVLHAPASERAEGVAGLRRAYGGLAAVIDEHNDREERALFPMLDKVTNDEERHAILTRVILY